MSDTGLDGKGLNENHYLQLRVVFIKEKRNNKKLLPIEYLFLVSIINSMYIINNIKNKI